MLHIKGLTKSFQEVEIFNDLNISLELEKVYMLSGRNGSGKTTLLKIISGIYLKDSGEISLNGIDLESLEKGQIAYISNSSRSLFMRLTVKQNLNFFLTVLGKGRRIDSPDLQEIFNYFSLEDLFLKKISQLSSGQIMRVNICRALLGLPKVLLLDESVDSLDSKNREITIDFLRNYAIERRSLVVLSTHNHAEYSKYRFEGISL